MLITDAQVHLFTVDPSAPLPDPVPEHRQKHPQGFTVEELIANMDEVGVNRAVVCAPSGLMANPTVYAQASARKYPGRLAIMDPFNPGAPEAKERLAWIKTQPDILGIRINVRSNRALFESGGMDWVWGECERLEMPVTLLIGTMSGAMLPVAKKYPGLKMTIDHLGRVPDVKGDAAFAGMDALLSLAPCENVGVKMTSAPDSSGEPYPFKDIYNGLKQIYDGFGPRRLLWGSDISGLSCSYRDCLRHFQEGLDFLSADDKEWILGKAAATMYGWPEA